VSKNDCIEATVRWPEIDVIPQVANAGRARESSFP
jgi:hypothetical protein